MTTMIREKKFPQGGKGFVFDIERAASHDGPGIRTTVFFKGCPLQCHWCHNPESWRRYPELGLRRARCIGCGECVKVCKVQAISLVDGHSVTDSRLCKLCGDCVNACTAGARQIIGQEMTVSQVMVEIEKDVIFYDRSGGGVTFSGGEPLMQPEFLLALVTACQVKKIHTAIDTSCYAEPQIIEKVSQIANLFLCDLKHMNSKTHERFTGVGNNLILDNIRRLSQAGVKIIIRIPVIPGFNDDQANIEATGKFIASLPAVTRIDILPYNRGGKEKSARLQKFPIADFRLPIGNRKSKIENSYLPKADEQKLNCIFNILSKYGLIVNIGG